MNYSRDQWGIVLSGEIQRATQNGQLAVYCGVRDAIGLARLYELQGVARGEICRPERRADSMRYEQVVRDHFFVISG